MAKKTPRVIILLSLLGTILSLCLIFLYSPILRIVGIFYIVCLVGLLKLREWARDILIITSILLIAIIVLFYVVFIGSIILGQVDNQTGAWGLAFFIGFFPFLVYNVLLLITLKRPQITELFEKPNL